MLFLLLLIIIASYPLKTHNPGGERARAIGSNREKPQQQRLQHAAYHVVTLRAAYDTIVELVPAGSRSTHLVPLLPYLNHYESARTMGLRIGSTLEMGLEYISDV